MVKVSIVMPLCNQEKYIKGCLESVINQTLKEIEIIVVDDGSKDNSLKIVNKLAKKDKRIIVISKKNSGYGNTMNVGMDKATGEYIGIVETDDYVEKTMFEKLYSAAKKYDADIVKSDYYTFTTKGGLSGKDSKEYIHTVKDGRYFEVMNIKTNPAIYGYEMNTWTGIYRTSFIRKNNIKHNETPGASYQDNGFWFQSITLAERIVYIDEAFYQYRFDNPNSSINAPGKVFCMCDEYSFIYDFVKNNPDKKKYCIAAYYDKKFWNYFYTYGRINDKYKLQFLERFSGEFKEAYELGELKLSYLNDWVANMLSRIMFDYEAFYYEDMLWRKNEKVKELEIKLNETKNSKYMIRGNKLLKPFKFVLGRK